MKIPFSGNWHENVLVLCVDSHRVAPEGNIGNKLLCGGVYDGHASTFRRTREVIAVGTWIVPDFVCVGPLRDGL